MPVQILNFPVESPESQPEFFVLKIFRLSESRSDKVTAPLHCQKNDCHRNQYTPFFLFG